MFFFFFNDTATTEIYTLSLHDALPISGDLAVAVDRHSRPGGLGRLLLPAPGRHPRHVDHGVGEPPDDGDRKSTRLNSSHANISYAVFCLKKKKNTYSIIYQCQYSRASQ